MKTRQTKPFPESEGAEQSLVKVQATPQTAYSPKRDRQSAEGSTGFEKIPTPNENRALPQLPLNEAPPSGGQLSLLLDWWRLIYQHKLLILSLAALVQPFVIINAYRKKPVYQATATIEVRMEGSSLKSNDVVYHGAYDDIKSEAFIIKSRPVIERAVANLNLDRYPHFFDVNSERSFREAITVLRGGTPASPRTGARSPDQMSGQMPGDRNQPAEPETVDGPAAAGNRELSAAERARLAAYVYTVIGHLRVDVVRDTRLLRLSFTHTDPEIAALVPNGVAQSFIEHNFRNRTQHFASASAWLEDSTRTLKARVEQAEQKLADYSRQHDIISLEGKENLTSEKLVRLHEQVMRTETDRLLKQSLNEEVKQGRIAELPEMFADPRTGELRKKLNDLAVTASQLSVKFGPMNPRFVEIRQQMAAIQEQIDANRAMLEKKLQADYERALRDEEALKAALGRAKAEAVEQNQAAIQYTILKQDQATAKALYTDFLNKTSQASIQLAEQYNNVRLIETADVPGAPIGTNIRGAILIWLFLSLAVGVGLAWLLENFNSSIRSVKDVNAAVQAPVLAVIPTLSDDSLSAIRTGLQAVRDGDSSSLRALDRPAKPVSSRVLKDFTAADEAYRMLRTSVLLSTAGRPPRTIMITSGQPGDGKTTTVINTAIAFTQLRAEVLIIDCDMRRPTIHELVRIETQKGLSAFLASGGNIAEFIRRTPIPYLSILPSGPTALNPSELISSDTMRAMLDFLATRYKYILIDSPPLNAVADARILSTMVDGVILVAKSGKSKSEALRSAFQNLSNVRARVLGVILNDLDMHDKGYDYYYSHNYRSGNAGRVHGNSLR